MHANIQDAGPAGGGGREFYVALMTVGRRLKGRVNDRFDPAALFVLHHVLANPQVRVSDLAGCMNLDASTVSRHVRHLEDAGYLSRSCDPDDRRASRVLLTEQGRALLDRAMDTRVALIDEALADWTEQDRATLTTLITRLAADLSERPERVTA